MKTTGRRRFLQSAFLTAGGMAAGPIGFAAEARSAGAPAVPAAASHAIDFPRTFTGAKVSNISCPIGGIGTGGVEFGGRGDFSIRNIFNRPSSNEPGRFCFGLIHVAGAGKAFTAVLERRLFPPYDSSDNYTATFNGIGLPRFHEATFRSHFPLAEVAFHDAACPVAVSVEAFSPFFPVDADESGLPVAVVEYTVRNSSGSAQEVAIAFSVDNPCSNSRQRVNVVREIDGGKGVFMEEPTLAADAARKGSFALIAMGVGGVMPTALPAWSDPGSSYSLDAFWDSLRRTGELPGENPRAGKRKVAVGSVALKRSVAAGATVKFRFVLAWHFPNRTPKSIGWQTWKGGEDAQLGNFYSTRFKDAWDAAKYAIANMPELEAKTRRFAGIMAASTLPAAVKDGAVSNLSTLTSNTSFRIADGSFHGWEGCGNNAGQGFGSCSHVWHYEFSTDYVFPSIARSMRETYFDWATDDAGHMDFRHRLPLKRENWNATDHKQQAAADGQMGQILHLYLDWRISGDTPWLLARWPGAKRAMEFAWIKGGWDANKDGVMEGAQHNTYDLEFVGPTGMIQSLYLGALKAAAAMARAAGDEAFATECERIFKAGSDWTDAHLFNGEFYVQQINNAPASEFDARTMAANLWAEGSIFQLGRACHVDQIMGQYMASLAGLGDLLAPVNRAKALRATLKWNPRLRPGTRANTQRLYSINDEPAINICAYKGEADIPVEEMYYAWENWNGLENAFAANLILHGMVAEGVKVVEDLRGRHDGERRNPFDEIEWGHHYARSMSSWATIPALTGFRHDAVTGELFVQPKLPSVRSIWIANTGWGEMNYAGGKLTLTAAAGTLSFKSLTLPGGTKTFAAPVTVTSERAFTA